MPVVRPDQDFGGVRVSCIDWPIVLVEFPEKGIPDATLRAVLMHLELIMTEAVRSREKAFFITDITRMRELTPAGQRQLTADWIKRTAALCRAAGVGGATVTPSSVLRGLITALYWLQPPPTPSFCVSSRHEGMLKGIELLEAAHALLSPRLIAYRDSRGARRTG